MHKDDGTRTSLQLSGDGDGTAEGLVSSPPGQLLADIICKGRDAARPLPAPPPLPQRIPPPPPLRSEGCGAQRKRNQAREEEI
jgi:hypothetical protein